MFAYIANYKRIPSARIPRGGRRTTSAPAAVRSASKTGDYFADAYMGLMRVGPAGGVAEVVAVKAGGVPFNFTNDVYIDQATSDVYFTVLSTSYPRTRKDTSLPCVFSNTQDKGFIHKI
jgi:hypothetical protein